MDESKGAVVAVCVDKGQTINPQALGDGLTLEDVQTGRGGFMAVLTWLLTEGWKGRRIQVIQSGDPLYETAREEFEDVSLDALEGMLRDCDQRTRSRVSGALEWQVNTAKMVLCGESANDPTLQRYRNMFGPNWGMHG